MRRYSYPPDEGTGKRPVRSAAAQSLREMFGGAVPGAAFGGERRIEGKGGKASASAGGEVRGREGRTSDKVENE